MQPRLRLMPLGGSITQGVGSTHRNGYREELMRLLNTNDYSVEMLGSRKSGTMQCNAHEGWRAFRIDEIEKKARSCVGGFRPNVLTVNAGSNDCLQNFDLDCIGKRMENMLDSLWKLSPGSAVILSTLVVHREPGVNARIITANRAFRRLVEEKAAQQKPIILADMHTPEGPSTEDLGEDDTHPGDVGYIRMAEIWFKAIEEATSRSLILGR